MHNAEYTAAVEKGEYPKDFVVPVDLGAFEDVRGRILNLLDTPITHISVITSKAGSRRASHYHLKNWHYTFVVSGSVFYYERAVGEKGMGDYRCFRDGDLFFTAPMREHLMVFDTDTTIITFSKEPKDHASHEADLVRVKFDA
jgi:quercetin dioxygenase-like cupin family protein